MSSRPLTVFRDFPIIMSVAFALLMQPDANAADAFEAGFRQMTVAANTPDAKLAQFAMYYPTPDAARMISMGPFPQKVAINGVSAPQFKGLIVISHGTVSTPIGFATQAQALARSGYLVASVEHAGDTWQDQSLRATAALYFNERPRQVSRVIDTLLADPQWRTRIASGTDGRPLIGAIGHSAGGYTVLALAGGKPVLSQLRKHCEAQASLDPVLCNLSHAIGGATAPADPSKDGQEEPVQSDTRVHAVMALAPLGVPFSASSLASITIPVAIYAGKKTPSLYRAFTRNG